MVDFLKDSGGFKDRVLVSESDDKAAGDDSDGGWQSEGMLLEHKEMTARKLLDRKRGREREREREGETETERDRDRDRERQRERETETQRETERDRERETERDRERERDI